MNSFANSFPAGSVSRYTVVGAGNGGKAMAAHLALMGFDVTLYNRTAQHIAMIKSRGGITLDREGCDSPQGFGKLSCVTSDMEEAVQGADVIMVVVPAFAHAEVARSMACLLKPGQIVILHPGRTLGAVEFHQVLTENDCDTGVIVAEAQTFIYASRSEGPARARIFKIKEAVPLAALPAIDTHKVLSVVRQAYPQYIDGGNTLQTGINNIGALFHPTISLLNTGWIEAKKGAFQFYLDGVTPTIAKILETLDHERMMIASALDIQAFSIREWLKLAYNADGENLHDAIHNQDGYRGINAPATLQHRYIQEDVPMSLVPLASMGRRFGVSVRSMESIIHLACVAHDRDYWKYGRTMAGLRIDQMSRSELKRYFNEGEGLGRKAPLPISGIPAYPATFHETPHKSGVPGAAGTT